jgi:hypothetical protein
MSSFGGVEWQDGRLTGIETDVRGNGSGLFTVLGFLQDRNGLTKENSKVIIMTAALLY